tara:strand:- start:1156 stop:2736 length:1581 start_codon:yes stop_codon:yes gene_type:complete
MQVKILITDPLSEKGLDILRNHNFDVVYKPNSSPEELFILVNDIDGWLIRSGTKVTSELLENARKLQIIGRAGVGTDNIDIDFATSKGIIVMNVPDGNTISAAEHTMAMLMSLSRNIYLGHFGLMKGEWNRSSLIGNELQNKILGVVGLGKIGREVIKRALSYDMKILGFDPYVNKDQFNNEEIEIVGLDTLVENSDFITLHLPINDNTRNLFNYDKIKKMKKTARIINVARGGIINEIDLVKALNEETIAGAAIDVFENEPIDSSNQIIKAKNILLTPHLGASTIEAKEGVTSSICNQMIDYFTKNKLTNALNIPISDSSLLNKLSSYYELAELMGRMQSQLIDNPIEKVEILCYGKAEDSKSIALSFLKGLLSNITDNRINFLNASAIADERGIIFSHSYSNDKITYTNKIKSIISSKGGSFIVSGSVFSDNFIRVTEIMGFDVDLKPEGRILFIKNKDVPGVIGKVGTILGQQSINISGYLLSKVEEKNFAYSVIKIDNIISDDTISNLLKIEELIEIKQLNL